MERTIAFLLLLVLVHYSSGLRLGQRGGATQGIALWGALEPTSNAEQHRRALNRGLGATAFLGALMTATCAGHAAEEAAIFRDAKNGFQLTVPEGFVTLPPRKVSQGEVSVGMPEDTLFLSQNFALGGTISVTRSNTQRLLADFGIPWASSRAIRSIGDVGNADLIAQLLLLQRQGAFGSEWFKTTLKTDSNIQSNLDNNISDMKRASLGDAQVDFAFSTPLSGKTRFTAARTVYQPSSIGTAIGNPPSNLLTAWISVVIPSSSPATATPSEAFEALSLATLSSFALLE